MINAYGDQYRWYMEKTPMFRQNGKENAMRNLLFKVEDQVCDDAMQLDEPDGKFDTVFSFGVIHLLEEWRKGISEVSRVIKSGGEFFFEEFLHPLTGNMLTKMLTPHPKGGAFDLAEFKQELKSVNIDIIKVRKVVHVAVFGVGRKR